MLHIKPFLILPFFLLLASCHSQSPQSQEQPKSNAPFSLLSPSTMDLTSRSPVLVSTDLGKSWADVSQGLPEDVQVSFMELLGDEIVLATDNLGLFISTNARTQWKQLTGELPSPKINALHVVDGEIYVGVYRQGIYRSDDIGKTWTSLNHDLPNLNVQSIWKSGPRLMVGTDAGIFALKEGMENWLPTSVKDQVLSIFELNGTLVAGTSFGTVVSKNEGANWNWIREEGAVHYTHAVGDTIVELCLNGDLYFSNDLGQSWDEFDYAPRMGSYVYEIAKRGKALVISNNYGIHRSVDQGKSWAHIFQTEKMGFFDFLVVNGKLYGGTRAWDEYRKRNR